jgi:four helix bundle protein
VNNQSEKPYDFEERARQFALDVRAFLKKLPRNINNFEDGKQLIRASGSIGANYIEANDPLGDKDMIMRMRIARKEARESRHWLLLLDVGDNSDMTEMRTELVKEAMEEIRILSAMIRNAQQA